jgi:hypothetical protein
MIKVFTNNIQDNYMSTGRFFQNLFECGQGSVKTQVKRRKFFLEHNTLWVSIEIEHNRRRRSSKHCRLITDLARDT